MQSIKYLMTFLIPFFTAFFIWSVIKLFLPNMPVQYVTATQNENFYNIRLDKIFGKSENFDLNSNKQNTAKKFNIKNVKLKAIYKSEKHSFILLKINEKTLFLDLNKTYKGYKLVKINNDSAVFKKDGKIFILTFNDSDIHKHTNQNKEFTYKKYISKQVITEYKNNLSKVWDNIGIFKNRRGYEITYVKKNSLFDKMGLKKGDIIIRVNNEIMLNDAKVWKLYNNIEKYDEIEIEIIRNNKLKVLRYEID